MPEACGRSEWISRLLGEGSNTLFSSCENNYSDHHPDLSHDKPDPFVSRTQDDDCVLVEPSLSRAECGPALGNPFSFGTLETSCNRESAYCEGLRLLDALP